MNSKKLRTLLMAGVALSSVVQANAQEKSPTQQFTFEIQSQDLAVALNQFATKTNCEILYAPGLVKNLRATKLQGSYAPKEALRLLLVGTGLVFEEAAQKVYILKPKGRTLPVDGKVPGGIQDKSSLVNGNLSREGATSSPDANKPGEITGRVYDTATERGLPGAILTLGGSTLTAVADDRGHYRFPAVPPGRYTLTVDYIGVNAKPVEIEIGATQRVTQNFETGALLEDIIVYANRSSLAQALNQQRSAANASTVIAADLLGSFPAESVAEALRRAPGVSFARDDVTGEGSSILIRGFSSEAINVQLNGIGMQGTGFNRTIDLNGFLADNISKVTIQKSLLPSQEASGTGGLVEIETRSGLDYGDQYLSLGIEGEQSIDSKYGDEFQANATAAWKLSDTLGVVGTLQYRKTDRQKFDVGVIDVIPPVLPAGYTSLFQVPESFDFPFDPETPDQLLTGSNFSQLQRAEENLVASLNVAWEAADHTTLKFDLQRIQRDTQTIKSRSTLSFLTRGVDMPIPELGGEIRRRTTLSGLRPTAGLEDIDLQTRSTIFSLRGTTDLSRWELDYKIGMSKASSKSRNQFISLIGQNATNVTDLIDPSTLATNPDDDAAGTLRVVDGGVIMVGDIPMLSLSQAGLDHIFDPSIYGVNSANRSFTNSPTEAYIGEFKAKYNFAETVLDYLEVGAKYDRSSRDNADDTFATSTAAIASSERYQRIFGRDTYLTSFADNAITALDLGTIGASGYSVPILRGDLVDDIFNQVTGLTEDNPDTPENEERYSFTDFTKLDPIIDGGNALAPSKTVEERLAAYIETKINIGKLEVVGGLRWERTQRNAVTISTPSIRLDLPGYSTEPRDTFVTAGLINFTDTGGTENTYTPSFLATYRHSDSLVVRLGYFRSTINPDFRLLSRPSQVFIDLRPGFGKGTIREANPDLKPTKTDNLDLDIAYYFKDSPGILRAAFFYKKVSNNFTSVLLADEGNGSVEARIREMLEPLAATRPDLLAFPADSEFFLNRPTNGEGGKIYGFELEAIRQLDFLPGFWSDFSLLGNLTYTNGDVPSLVSARNDAGEAISLSIDGTLLNQARWSGTASLAYERDGFSGRLIYSFQTQSVSAFDEFNLNSVTPSYATLDMRTSYRFELNNTQLEVFLEGDNLLKSSRNVDVRSAIAPTFGVGSPDFYYPQSLQYNGGRTVTIGLQARF
ncbi:TonB-dependent receptor [Paremcibacter congregatus]|uniref:TonB-dependent receptor n=1 Tax=Paremcibacter congregatus TaxID=2043170 RepID=UPI003A95D2A2